MNVPFFSFEQRNRDIREEAIRTFEKFFDSGWYVLGQSTTDFEDNYARYSNVDFCVGVSNGLDALHLALRAIGIEPGDEVIVPSNTYIASVLAVSYSGAKPVFVEPRMETANINPELIESSITPKTKAIMPVHLYGQACEMDAIMSIAEKYGLYVIEDNAQAHGSSYNGKKTGSFGHINATSFYPTKNIGALGEAGAITTDNEALAEKVRVLRNYGSQKRYFNEVIGYNNRIDEFEAAFLDIALNYIDSWTDERQKIASLYNEGLAGLSEIITFNIAKGSSHVFHLFVIRCERRDELRSYLESQGVGTQIHYPIPPHLQSCYEDLGFIEGDYPIAEELANTSVSLPLYLGLDKDRVDYISHHIKTFFGE